MKPFLYLLLATLSFSQVFAGSVESKRAYRLRSRIWRERGLNKTERIPPVINDSPTLRTEYEQNFGSVARIYFDEAKQLGKQYLILAKARFRPYKILDSTSASIYDANTIKVLSLEDGKILEFTKAEFDDNPFSIVAKPAIHEYWEKVSKAKNIDQINRIISTISPPNENLDFQLRMAIFAWISHYCTEKLRQFLPLSDGDKLLNVTYVKFKYNWDLRQVVAVEEHATGKVKIATLNDGFDPIYVQEGSIVFDRADVAEGHKKPELELLGEISYVIRN